MNADRILAKPLNWLVIFIFIASLFVALVGLTNSYPQYWIIPRLGPFAPEIIRPLMLGASVFLVILKYSFTSSFSKSRPKLKWLGFSFDVFLMAIVAFALWRFSIDMLEMVDTMVIFGPSHAMIALAASAVFIILCWRVWGAALAIVGIVALFYYFTGPYWPGIFKTAPFNILSSSAEDLWFNLGEGIVGGITGILIFTAFPFVLLGAMLERTGGARSLIKIAFHFTRNLRGGPAHAAIMSSALFGTMSGAAVTNVVATGVITIPMIKRRGFSPAFAGGVEATASSAGQIMPPVMGAAALVMADITEISYIHIIIAALIPALAYYASLFTSVVFESRRLGIEAVSDLSDTDIDLAVHRQDYYNLILIVVPIATVVYALLSGFSPAGAGNIALTVLIPLSFLNPEVRQNPFLIIRALANGGRQFGELLMSVAVVGIIVAVLAATGLPNDFTLLLGQAGGSELVFALMIAAAASLMLSMGIPTLPAYLTVVLILGPSLTELGVSTLVAHLFVLYFCVASSITPPVAIAAYAAASIADGPPMMTAVYAMRIGLVKFLVPFVFAFYPVILIVEASGVAFDIMAFLSIIVRLSIVIYLVSSAVIGFDRRRLPAWEIIVRLILGILIIFTDPFIHWSASAAALVYLLWHNKSFRMVEAS
ncbi:MAG: TRAP transporter fused permease subunit [Rhodospirillales bacterium]|jgi:TRAP transporter 4TM/12TM fusion protein|nr:TRAP transporter fused permease subunit [Rhodospirillales bacterium]